MTRPSLILALAAGATLAAVLAFYVPGLKVVDGDTVHHGFWTYRLTGFDAPEIQHAKCAQERENGKRAKARLEELVGASNGNWQLINASRARDQYGRRLARLEIAGKDVGETLVDERLALDYDGGKRPPWCGPVPMN